MSTLNEKLRDEALVAEAYERVKVDLEAVPADQLVQLNVDVHAATRAILGALPEMQALRGRLIEALPEFDAEAFDKLEDYVWALRYAQATYYIATQPPDDLEEMTAEGTKLRDRMVADMKALQAFGLIGSKALDSLKGGLGFNNLAIDLDILARAMTEEWTKISAHAHTTLEEVNTAYRIGARLTRIAGLREQGPARLAAATELRMRAFTVLLRTYEEARDAIGYVRRHQDDVDSIAPSLYPGRPRRREIEEVPVTPVPVPATTPGGNATAPSSPVSGVPPAPAARVVDDRGPFLT
jgi:hypothetical protein